MKIIFASHNEGKVSEIKELLKDFEILSLKDVGFFDEIEETGSTFYENAFIKAKTVSEKFSLPVLSDDSGLCVNALLGAPGIYSARYSGKGNEENINLLLKNLQGKDDRSAKFVCTMVTVFPNGDVLKAVGETFGEILSYREGDFGFGYDPVFYSYDLKKSFGVSTKEEKNSVSHRSRAVKIMKELLKNYYENI